MAMTRRLRGKTAARNAALAFGRPAVLPCCLLIATLCPGSLAAQQPSPEGRPWIATVAHHGKWPALAGSVALLARAALDRRDADARREELNAHCLTFTPCDDTRARELGAAADARDARAHRLIVAGELTLIATGAFFVIDLIHGGDGPPNIPFTPFTVLAGPRTLGVRASF